MILRMAAAAAILLAIGTAGCSDFFPFGPAPVTVEVFNNSDFDVLPDIRFDPDQDVPSAIAAETLVVGELFPGEFVQFDIDCDRIGLIFSDETELAVLGQFFGIAEASIVARYGRDFECGDFLVIEFFGNEIDGLDIFFSVNDFPLN